MPPKKTTTATAHAKETTTATTHPRTTTTATTHAKKTKVAAAPAKATGSKTRTSVVRSVAPMIPLAIALVHGTVTANNPPSGTAGGTGQPSASVVVGPPTCGGPGLPACTGPSPLLQKGHQVAWWFVFKFNSKVFPGCGGDAKPSCPFGGDPQNYKNSSQQFVYASSDSPTLQ